MRFNTSASIKQNYTHEGAPAKRITPEQALRRSILSCLLWEKEFYEDGKSIVDRIIENAAACSAETVSALAIEARNVHGLRHAPLMLLLDIIRRGGSGVSDTIAQTLRRADEMAELVAIYWKDGKKPLSKQMKLGLAKTFGKFSEYQLAKYDRDGAVRLRDVLFLAHPKPKDEGQEALFKRVAERQLVTPDTWEVALSGGADKKETFERLIREGQLGYLALLRNLRNMMDAGCDRELVKDAIGARKGADLIFPFRYVAAARACPQMEPYIDQALCEAIAAGPRLSGSTAVLVDVSGSMDATLSSKSDMKRIDAAAALASVINGDVRVFTFSQAVVEVPPRRGMAGVDAVIRSQPHSGTYLGAAVQMINQNVKHDRLIVITDEQSADRVPDPIAKSAYMINVASARNGVGYGKWCHLDGFSEAVIRFISEVENDR
ncbi:TROVE domain-containing protein [Rhizobium sp. No.120]